MKCEAIIFPHFVQPHSGLQGHLLPPVPFLSWKTHYNPIRKDVPWKRFQLKMESLRSSLLSTYYIFLCVSTVGFNKFIFSPMLYCMPFSINIKLFDLGLWIDSVLRSFCPVMKQEEMLETHLPCAPRPGQEDLVSSYYQRLQNTRLRGFQELEWAKLLSVIDRKRLWWTTVITLETSHTPNLWLMWPMLRCVSGQ